MVKMRNVNGCKIYIGGAPLTEQDADWDATDFTAVTWTQIQGWTQMGSLGDARSLTTSDQIDAGRTKKAKGPRNAGSMQNNFDADPTDPGQIALLAAVDSDYAYPFKVELNDTPATGSAPTPSQRLFTALVMGVPEQGGTATAARTIQSTLEIDSNIVHVAASAGA